MAKSNRIYHYHVSLLFRGKGTSFKIGRKTSGYSGTHSYQDTFVFFQKTCNLVLSRTKKFEDGTILSNTNNSITTQIIKALLCYYAITKDFPVLDSITIIRKKANEPDFVYSETDSFIQPIMSKVPRSLLCNPSTIDGLLEDNHRGQTLRIAMSYWLKGIASDDVYYRFEHFWRAFNRLFMYQGNYPKEFNCMVVMRDFILNNAAAFSQSIAITNAYSENMFMSYRWVRMILNDYDTPNKTKALSDFIQRYHDCRIMKMFQQKIVCRTDYLNSSGLWQGVNTHIMNNMTSRVDAELVTLIALKYGYFVRNKMFHGEIIDGTFRIRKNNLDNEVQCLNGLLETLVFEIMENYLLLRL